MCPKSKKTTIVINTKLLAYTFNKLGMSLTNNDDDILITTRNSAMAEGPLDSLSVEIL